MFTKRSISRNLSILFNLLIILSLLMASVMDVTPAHAATFTVNNTNDTSDASPGDGTCADGGSLCSLRAAIEEANALSGADTITLPAGTYTLTSGSELLVTSDITINGAGAATTNIEANANPNTATYRVLEVSPTGDLTLNSLKVRNGRCNGSCATYLSYGGGILNNAGTLTLDAGTISLNTASGVGGGIFNGGILIIQNGSLIGGAGAGNSADWGGGIDNSTDATTTIDASTVSANAATSGGGGIYNYDGTVIIQNGSVIGGVGAGNAATNGGGIFNYGGSTATTIDASTVSVNSATGGGNGGGIYNNGTLTVQNGSVIGGVGGGNAATNGGGIFNTNSATIDASTVSGNAASSQGGGIYHSGGALTVQNGSLIGGAGVGNYAVSGGGGIFSSSGTTTIDASTVSANTTPNNGGGIYNTGTLTVQNGSLIGGAGTGNATSGGGHGGGIYNSGATTVDASTVRANTAAGYGGGIYSSTTLTVQNGSVIAGNLATTGGYGGGGIYNYAGTTTISASMVSSNTADYGGGIFNNAGTTTIVTSTISANTTPIGTGLGTGAFYNESTATASVTGSCVVGNSSIAFWNNNGATQTATGNWWGAADGPNPPGSGGTLNGNWNTSGYLTTTPTLCGAPGGLAAAANGQTAINLTWTDNSSDETQFRVERSPNGTTGWTEIAQPAANATGYLNSGLTCNTAYHYRMRAYRSGDGIYSPYSNTSSATTLACPDTTAPTVVSSVRANSDPTSAASVDFTVTFSESVTGVGTGDFTLTKIGVTGASVSGVSGTGTTYTISVDTGAGDGTIRLDVDDDDTIIDAASNPLGGAGAGNGDFITGETYTVTKPGTVNLSAPVLRSPASDLVTGDTTPSFAWSTVRGGGSYEIVIATEDAFTNLVYGEIVAGSTTTLLSALTDGPYFWRVRAYNAADQPGVWSSPRSFTIDTTGPSAPVLTSPADSASTRTPTFRWTTVPTAVSYQFQYDNDSNFSSPTYTITINSNFRRPPAMAAGNYSWHVRARDATGNWGPWSTPRTVDITGP